MTVSQIRFKRTLPYLHHWLREADIANRPTMLMSTPRSCDTDRLPPLAFYLIEEPIPLMKVVKSIARWVREHDMPPYFIGLAPSVLNAYWEGINWQRLHLSTYYYRLPDGSLFPVELGPMELPTSIVYCGMKRT